MSEGDWSRGAPTPRSDDDRGIWPSAVIDGEIGRARKEWLHTNGAGAYASSTLAGMHTRRYHGLLVAALDPPRSRHVILSHVDVTARVVDDAGKTRASFELARHQFPGINPEATELYLQRFDQDPLPRWTYRVAGGELEVTLALVRGENAAVLRYVFRGLSGLVLNLRPLMALRHFHHLQHENGGMEQRATLRAGEMHVQPRRDLPRVCFRYEGTFVGSPDWWRRFEYLAEQARGLDFHEDLWTPGIFEVRLGAGPSYLVAAVERLPEGEPEALLAAAAEAIRAEDPGPTASPLVRRLSIAAETFRADLAQRPGIIAGYPWFEVWGRDTLIALPGLYLVTGKLEGAMRILREMFAAMQDGLVPNRIPDVGEAAEFHTADATLWLFEAGRLVADRLGETHPFVTDELLLALHDAFEAVLRGTRNGIHLTADGLFAAGRAGDSLTWMDARVATIPVTPRVGCPIELSALWAKGCDTLSRLARAAGDQPLADRAFLASRRARAAFRERFWCEQTAYPFDVVSEEREGETAFHDASIRPNAIIALAVDPDCFTAEQAAMLLDRARQELVTRAGLRTLAPSEAAYVGHYAGGVAARDGSYHQGTVWPFLLGFFVRAAMRGVDAEHLAPFLERLVGAAAANEIALGQVAEIADGDAPHAPNGCFAQAWSVAELLRAAAWDLKR